MDDNSVMPFGAHKGKKFANIPAKYFLWLEQQSWIKPDLREYIEANAEVFKAEIEREEQK